MLLVGVLFGLVTVGFVVPCLIDVAVTPRYDLRSLTKPAWAAIIVFLSVFGATAWLVAGRPDRRSRVEFPRSLLDGPSFSQQDALRRHPAGRAMDPGIEASGRGALRATEAAQQPTGPDDDEEFLQELTRRIRDAREDDER
jgi:hypothetical protein